MRSRLGELEGKVMERVWSSDTALSVRDVCESLQREREIAYTTVMTIMQRLARKGFLTRVLQGRAHLYTASLPREGYIAELMTDALDTAEDRAATLVRFVERLGPEESAALRASLRSSARRGGRSS